MEEVGTMRLRNNVELGVLSIALSILLALVGISLGYVVLLLEPIFAPTVSAFTFHTAVVPAIGLAVDVGIAVLGLVGLYLLHNGRWALPSNGPAKLNLATLAFILGAAAVVVRGLLGVAAGFTVLPDLRLARAVLGLAIAVGLGFFLYWVLDAVGLIGPQVVGIVALVLGVVGATVEGFARYLPRRAGGFETTTGQGALLVLLSVVLWLAAYVWGVGGLRARRMGRPASTRPAETGTNR